jgi:hypothetical protein
MFTKFFHVVLRVLATDDSFLGFLATGVSLKVRRPSSTSNVLGNLSAHRAHHFDRERRVSRNSGSGVCGARSTKLRRFWPPAIPRTPTPVMIRAASSICMSGWPEPPSIRLRWRSRPMARSARPPAAAAGSSQRRSRSAPSARSAPSSRRSSVQAPRCGARLGVGQVDHVGGLIEKRHKLGRRHVLQLVDVAQRVDCATDALPCQIGSTLHMWP